MIYRVEVTKTLYVVADDNQSAEDVALEYYQEEDGPDAIDVTSCVPVTLAQLSEDTLESLPWGTENDERTIREHLS